MFLHEHLPLPEPQVDIHDARGFAGRVDFLWREQRTIGEFDGRIKYGRLVPAGRSPEDALWNEKLREDRLRDAGWEVARWTWADLSTPVTGGKSDPGGLRAQPRGRQLLIAGFHSSSVGIPGGVNPSTCP